MNLFSLRPGIGLLRIASGIAVLAISLLPLTGCVGPEMSAPAPEAQDSEETYGEASEEAMDEAPADQPSMDAVGYVGSGSEQETAGESSGGEATGSEGATTGGDQSNVD